MVCLESRHLVKTQDTPSTVTYLQMARVKLLNFCTDATRWKRRQSTPRIQACCLSPNQSSVLAAAENELLYTPLVNTSVAQSHVVGGHTRTWRRPGRRCFETSTCNAPGSTAHLSWAAFWAFALAFSASAFKIFFTFIAFMAFSPS